MRLQARIFSVLLAIVTSFSAFSQNVGQITIERSKAPISVILDDIEHQTDYLFVYQKDVDVTTVKDIKMKNAGMEKILDHILSGTGIGYKFSQNYIILYKIDKNKPATEAVPTLRGKVTDANGEPLIGVYILQKGKDVGEISDLDGNFSIKADRGDVLTFSHIGFVPVDVTVKNLNNLVVRMEEDLQTLDAVVYIGYGTSRKKDLTGSVSQFVATQVEKEAPRSIADAIRGGVAGLTLGMSTTPAGTADIQIRGKNTLSAGSSPLYVLDGVIYKGELTDINPNDIESIDVLKDASSVAIYGAKAANGVIAITTKRGNVGKPRVTLNTNIGLATAANVVKTVDGQGFIRFRHDFFEGQRTDAERQAKPGMYDDPRTLDAGINTLDWYNYTQNVPASSLPDEDALVSTWLSRLAFSDIEVEHYLKGIETDWDREVFKTGLQQDYTVSMSNKNDKASYYASLGYANREGTVVGAGYENYRARINLDADITRWLTVGINTQFAARNSGWLRADTDQRRNLSPWSTNDIDDPTSIYRQYPNGNNNSVNPFFNNYFIDRRAWNYELTANIFAKVKLPFGFDYQVNFSPRQHWYEYFNHQSADNPSWAGKGGESERTNEHTFNWMVDNIIHWNKSFGAHRFELTLLQSAEQNQFWSSKATNKQYSPSDVLGYHRLQSGTEPTVSSEDRYSTGDALMARLFYSLKDRYMLTASIRRDGFSAFGQANPWATFPSLALAWVFSREDFLKGATWLDFGKLRASYGINGNRDIGIYAALAQLTTGMSTYLDQTGNPYITSQIYISVLGNKSLRWEQTAAWNLGLDFSLFNGLVEGNIDAYKSTTTDLLVDRTLPPITGYDSIKANLGELSNHGFELALSAHPVRNNNFKWDTQGTFYFNRRKIVHLYGDMEDVLDEDGNVIGQKEADDYDTQLFIGHDPDQIWAYERNGVWQLGEEEEALKYGCQPGDFRYVDQNTNDILNSDDKIFMGYKTPRFQASWKNEFTFWNNLTLSCMMYGKFGHYGDYNRAANSAKLLDVWSIWDIPWWTPENPTNDYGRLGSYNAGTNFVKKSFVRVESLTLSYALPKSILTPVNVEQARVSFSVRNPFVFTSWTNGDVEGGDFTMRTFNFSLNLTL